MKFSKLTAAAAVGLCIVLVVISAGCTGTSTADLKGSVSIASTDLLSKPMDDILKAFEKTYRNVNVTHTYGTGSDLADRISAGTLSPDVFIAADMSDMNKIVSSGYADNYSILKNNPLVICVAEGNPKNIGNLGDLAGSGIRIAAGTDGVPFAYYGNLTVLKYENAGHSGYAGAYRKNIVLSVDTVSAARDAVINGDCDAALVYESSVNGYEDSIDSVPVDDAYLVTAEFPFTVLKKSYGSDTALAFLRFMTGANGNAIFKYYGFTIKP